jgi:hypothetical protein
VILGYYQQGQELRENAKALRAQEQELEKQVKATQALVELERQDLDQAYQSQFRPVLVFENPGQKPWRIRNVGKGPAINVTAGGGSRSKEWDSDRVLLFAALAPGETIPMEWVNRSGALFAVYSDVGGREYTSECSGNRNRMFDGNRYPEVEPSHFQYQLGSMRRSRHRALLEGAAGTVDSAEKGDSPGDDLPL